MRLVRKRISQLGRVVTGKTPPTAREELFKGDYLFVTPSDLDYSHYYCRETERTVSEQAKAVLANQFIPAGAVMFTCIGATIGKCAIASGECLTNQQINSVVANDATDPKFLYYLLCKNVDVVKGMGGGAATPIVNKSKFEDIEFLVPPLRQQHETGRILSAYDDLIENNRRRIALLEEAARMLYREWFVHFRFPGHEHVKIIDGLPEGWRTAPIQSICGTYDDGDWLETKDQGGSDYRILQISNIGNNSFVETGNWRFITEETFRRLSCHEIVPGDILVSRMPTPIGRGWLVTEMPFRMVTAVDGTIIRADQNQANPYYLLYHINSDQNIRRCEGSATGSTRPRISRKTMGSLPIAVPPMHLQKEFAVSVAENNRLRANLVKQNDGLAQARDLLLPNLMNGKIAV